MRVGDSVFVTLPMLEEGKEGTHPVVLNTDAIVDMEPHENTGTTINVNEAGQLARYHCSLTLCEVVLKLREAEDEEAN